MKKVLFATTALIATAGVASADIALSGDARMGIANVDSATATDAETQFDSRVRFTFTFSGTTDTGLSFGASARADNAGDAASGTAGSVYVSGAFGKVTMGDINSAHESANGDLHGVTYTTGASHERHLMGYTGGDDDEGLAYEYSLDNLTIYASMGQPQTAAADDQSGIGIKYTMDNITVGAGIADHGLIEETAVSVRATFGALSLAAIILDRDNDTTITGEQGISASYAIDSNLSVSAFTRTTENTGTADLDYNGVGFAYNLGGGASLKGGIIDGGANGSNLDSANLGLNFSF